MVSVSGSQCGRCFDHDSTNLSACVVFLRLGRESLKVSKLKLGYPHSKSISSYLVLFKISIYCCGDLHVKQTRFRDEERRASDDVSGLPVDSYLIQIWHISEWWKRHSPVFFDGQARPNPPTQWHTGNMFQGMILAYPLTLNHCQSFVLLGSLGNRNRSNITSPPICLALTREVHAVFMPVWDGFKLFSYQKAHSDILFERHCKP